MAAKTKIRKKTKTKSDNTVSRKPSLGKSSASSTKKKTAASSNSLMKSKKYIALVLIIVIAGSLYLLRGQFLAAIVNGTPITRFAVIQELETQSGPAILDQLVTESLVKQDAQERGVTVTQTDIDAEIAEIQKNIENQGQNLEDLLALQGMTMEDLRGRVDTQLTLEKLLEDKVDVEQSEVDDFIEQSKESLPDDMTAEEIERLARDQLVQQKLQTEIQTYLQELRDSADIQYFGTYQTSLDQ